MALRGMDGFDHYAAEADFYARKGALQWLGPMGFSLISFLPGRGDFGKALGIGGYSPVLGLIQAAFDANYSTLRVGFAARWSNTVATPSLSIIARDPLADVTQCTVRLDNTGLIRAFDNTGSEIGVSANNAFNPGTWSFVEIGFGIASSAGWIAVQIDGVPVLTATGNTQASGNNTLGAVGFLVTSGALGAIEIDDFRYSDTVVGPGSFPCDSWLGDLRVATLAPRADSSTGWTPLANANWQEVSETTFDGDTSYNGTTTIGAEDLFVLDAPVPTISQVIALQVTGAYRATDTSPHSITQQVSSGGSEVAGPVHTLSMGYQFFSDLYPLNPVSATNWTLNDVFHLLAGYVAVS